MAKDSKIEELSYEQAFAELQKIVAELEEEMHDLDKAVDLFERGQALAQHCSALLDNAELKVQALTEDGELEDFE
jgi:exodeoxyribonuclease VII small subunit